MSFFLNLIFVLTNEQFGLRYQCQSVDRKLVLSASRNIIDSVAQGKVMGPVVLQINAFADDATIFTKPICEIFLKQQKKTIEHTIKCTKE